MNASKLSVKVPWPLRAGKTKRKRCLWAITRTAELRCLSPRNRYFSTQPRLHAETNSHYKDDGSYAGPLNAAAPIDFKAFSPNSQSDGKDKTPLLKRIRVVPASRSYFTVMPYFADELLELQRLYRIHQYHPQVDGSLAPASVWTSFRAYKGSFGEPVPRGQFSILQNLLVKLNRIHPDFQTPDLIVALNKWRQSFVQNADARRPIEIDEFGRSLAVGRRKSASAKVWVVPGNGQILVNDRPLNTAFDRVYDRESALFPLKIAQRVDKYNVYALVTGGGKTGQAEAITLAMAKALVGHEPRLKTLLRKAGCISRDIRSVERKKHGRVKARKMPAWVKR